MGAGAEDDRPWDEPDKTGEGKGKEAASEVSFALLIGLFCFLIGLFCFLIGV